MLRGVLRSLGTALPRLTSTPHLPLQCPTFRLDASTSRLSSTFVRTAPDAAVSREEGDVQPAEKAKEKRGPVKRTPPKPRPKRVYPDLVDSEIEETWVRGSGPGGQSINKTNISCSLRHLPTGIRVQCHETRSRELNRTKARRRLQEKLDLLRNPGKSILEEKWERERKKKQAKKRKGKKKDGKDGAEEEKDEVDVEATQKSDEQP